jgi:hypothetical protein
VFAGIEDRWAYDAREQEGGVIRLPETGIQEKEVGDRGEWKTGYQSRLSGSSARPARPKHVQFSSWKAGISAEGRDRRHRVGWEWSRRE